METKTAAHWAAASLSTTYKVAAQGLEECMRVCELLPKATVARGVLFICRELRRFGIPIWSHSILVNPSVFEPLGNEMGTAPSIAYKVVV